MPLFFDRNEYGVLASFLRPPYAALCQYSVQKYNFYFNNFRFPTSSKMVICWMAILLSFRRRSRWGMPCCLNPSNSMGLKLGLYKDSHNPKYSIVFRLRIQLLTTTVGSNGFFCRAMSVMQI